MNRIDQLFQTHKDHVLSIYFCAGTPTLEGTAEVIRTLERKGVQMIEIGIPFSDPMADGPVIQHAATQALRNGMTLRKLFGQLEQIRTDVRIPLVLMGYIIPDLPYKDYLESYRPIAQQYGIHVIMLITPETSEERIRQIDAHTDGFIYMVSSAAVTGAQKEFNAQKQAYFQRIKQMQLRNPRMIGFGISNKLTYESAAAYASGCIIGSKFVTLLEEEKDAGKVIDKLLEMLKNEG